METKLNELFWEASIEEVKSGIIETEKEYICVVCEKIFEKGRIYEIDSNLYDAKKAAELHIAEAHESMLSYLLQMNSTFTGVSGVQGEIVKLISKGLSDKEIAASLGVAGSTIRNHRYKLREKEKQARLFLAMMDLLSESSSKKISTLEKETICDPHKSATALDDRYNITDKEKADTLKTYMDENGALKNFPVKAKKKIIVLEEITKSFSKGKMYSEKEVNRVLKRIYEDHVTIRRALIEYGFFDRKDDCSSYWVKE